MEYNWPTALIFVHQARVLKVGNKGSLPLDSSICQRSHFLTIELLPFFPIKCLRKWYDERRRQHVNECIAHVAFILHCNGQIQKVIGASMMFINSG
nr:hypothetical protein Iba_chr06aCG17920 [Ipomoea batatas]GMD08257.1 hypothetical protein Iba_chr06cCG14920 [Ipomoea batatas]